ncbi:aminoglycoside N(3)-acetyltransferase [Halegenticoccus soli]|uniref:aminoglycoside N(3)-acetyltransferase n=1 Tax=Halegenticoccus soli TaxID=1985678 RepID=UPI000C6E2B25|nr:AAC(3) family N-acetyltransferase [Halegenticoccus soli]
MGEKEAIERVADPATVSSLAADLRDLGVREGDALLVHSSLSALGWVCGGAQAVVDALREAVTDSGTLVMPTHTGQYTDPAGWSNPPVPEAWVDVIRDAMPPFRPDVTPTRGMGAIPECFRNYPDVVRSEHPEVSFAAWGADAQSIATGHGFDYGLGENSPLARVYERNGDVLLLGVGHDSNTSLHLAEYRADVPKETAECGAPVLEGGRRRRVEYEDIETSTDDFPDLGAEFERRIGLAEGRVGDADAKLASQRALVDFAVEWFEANR